MSTNLNILVEAKKEYLFQLVTVMCPYMIQAFQDIYNEAKKVSKGKKVLLKYQTFLREVLNWNGVIVKARSDDICNSCSWFSDLLAAVFVSHVKILASVKLNSNSNKISIKLPSNTLFIHTCYINVAKEIYKDPYVFYDEMTDSEREENLSVRMMKCIDQTVKELVPIQDILKANISQNDTKEVDIMSEAPEDTPDPDVLEEEFNGEEPEPEEELGQDMDEDIAPPVEEPPLGSEPDPEIVETKDIGINNIKPQHEDAIAEAITSEPEVVPEPTDEEDDVFFGDATDAKRNS